LAVYAPRVKAKVDLLLSKIAEHGGRPIDMTEYAMFFGFDVMGDVGMCKPPKSSKGIFWYIPNIDSPKDFLKISICSNPGVSTRPLKASMIACWLLAFWVQHPGCCL
jgi:hypothetical protein